MTLSMVNHPKCEPNQILSAKTKVMPKFEHRLTINFGLNVRISIALLNLVLSK